MAQYRISYLDGEDETVTATQVVYDSDARDYTFRNGNRLIALVPTSNVRSVHRQDDEAATD